MMAWGAGNAPHAVIPKEAGIHFSAARAAEEWAPAFAGGRSFTMSPLNLPPVIGHRGAAAHAPENTLAGFRAAKTMGCAWVEFDVRLTADGALVACHDDRLDRTTGGRGRISKLPLAALRAFDAGGWFKARFAGERIPTLDEVLALCCELGLGANVEIKAERGRASATAAAVADCLDRLADVLPPILISSFLPDAVATAAERMPKIPRGMLWRKLPRGWRQIAANFGCTTIHLGQADLTQTIAAEVRAAGYPLLVYTVNDAAGARQLFGWGVTSVFSDAPDIIAAALPEDLAGA
jgi:glycerophosphoryl diester phosphodiesterase